MSLFVLEFIAVSKQSDIIILIYTIIHVLTYVDQVELEGLDKNTREARRIASENEMK